MNYKKIKLFLILIIISAPGILYADISMQNVSGREKQSLNGVWNILIDAYDEGLKKKWYILRDSNNGGLNELCYEGNLTLRVPGDWNHQLPELYLYEGHIWYQRRFDSKILPDKRMFLHFGAVSNNCIVFLNGEKIGEHKGGFTPFQFEVTGKLKEKDNYIILRVDNIRGENTIPALSFDWWNYGGITRDVDLVYVPENYIQDYFIRVDNNDTGKLDIKVKLNGENVSRKEIVVELNEINKKITLKTDENGIARSSKKISLELWSPEKPKLYDVAITSGNDKITDRIGFRSIKVDGNKLLLNGKPIYLRGVNFHEEIANEKRRAYSKADAEFLGNSALEMNCNFIRLAHYPQSEYTVRLAEEKGILMWEEIPLWQKINFASEEVCKLAETMADEMIQRDKNRCGVIIWSISNETSKFSKPRNKFLAELVTRVKSLDNTRLVSSALHQSQAVKEDEWTVMKLEDPLIELLDVVGYNKYLGWYQKFPCEPENLKWEAYGKPLIISEFGAECVQGNNLGDTTNLNSWSETYMENVYKKDLISFDNSEDIVGLSPWILFDFRVPRRSHALFQKGWNRKGLISPEYRKKNAWYVMKCYYDKKYYECKE